MEQRSSAFLGTEKIGTLMWKYAVPCITSLVVAALSTLISMAREILFGVFLPILLPWPSVWTVCCTPSLWRTSSPS